EVDEDHALQLYSLIYNNTRNSSEQRTKALFNFGDIALRKGNRESAVTAYAKIINGDADSIAVSEAKQRISRIHENMENLQTENP
ncbi:tol-pal system YbgF family protein, partial [Candidatus Latescibacterota bacterium]